MIAVAGGGSGGGAGAASPSASQPEPSSRYYNKNVSNTYHGYMNRTTAFYRKHFSVPASWRGTAVYVDFGGVYHYAQVWLNGVLCGTSSSGYSRFVVRIDNCTVNTTPAEARLSGGGESSRAVLRYSADSTASPSPVSPKGANSSNSSGDGGGGSGTDTGSGGNGGSANVIAVRADASYGSGHWYEGGGIYRPARLVSTPLLHFEFDSITAHFVPHNASSVAVEVQYTVVNDAAENTPVAPNGGATASVSVELLDFLGNSLGSTTVPIASSIPAHGGRETASVLIHTTRPLQRWEPAGSGSRGGGGGGADAGADPTKPVAAPALYTLVANVTVPDAPRTASSTTAAVTDGGGDDDIAAESVDSQTIEVGYRELLWNASGLHVNSKRYQLRGFSNHNSFAVVGVSIPPRINLFRAQAVQAMGANVWRGSHNPVDNRFYSILDNLGMMMW